MPTAPPPQPPPPPPPAAPVAADTTPAPAATAAATPAAPVLSLTDKELATLKALRRRDGRARRRRARARSTPPDAVFKFAGMPDMTKDVFLAHQKDHFASFPDSKGAARRIFIKNDVAVLEWTMTGTNSGPGPMGAKSTGKSVGVNGLSIVWFTPDGLIKEQHEYLDVPTMMGQLGMAPKGMKTRAPATLPDGKPDVHVSKNTPDEDKNAASAAAVQKMFETHDSKAFADTQHRRHHLGLPLDAPAPMKGKKEMVKYFDMFDKAIPDMKLTCQTWAVNDYVIEECAMTGTNKGGRSRDEAPGDEQAAQPPRRRRHPVEGRQGSGRDWSYGNGMEMAMQLGLIKPPGEKKDADRRTRPSRRSDGESEQSSARSALNRGKVLQRLLAASLLVLFAASCGGAADEQAPLKPLPPPTLQPPVAASDAGR